jgi:hypothetical protein
MRLATPKLDSVCANIYPNPPCKTYFRESTDLTTSLSLSAPPSSHL